ncbi:MAG: TVP38/TMEM64 family protein [Proteobacteria bacterium]|nr:TVP38/TMEM64 family protein [Pseudomonadota bacterium]MBU1418613.1 TVP38/TMEM64 family protein [Pseudomonadota bacterium]MBU1454177.1 TVP38/TMEM64 family protein [Pseudomonadota bacterium]
MSATLYKKIGILVAILALLLAFWLLDLAQYLNLGYLKESQAAFAVIYSEHRLLVIAGYMLIYITATALSLPGALILTLAGGALFGLVTGIIVISFASSIGATLACGVSRYLLRDWVQSKFGDKLQKINEGMEKEGGFYLFTLRLVPIFPFFVINLVMGLATIRLSTYYWVSQLGMLPATIVYVNAGKELGKIDSLSGILSPGLIISFVLLGLFPITAKKLLTRIRNARKEKS